MKNTKLLQLFFTYVFYVLVIAAFIIPIYWVLLTSFKDPKDMFVYPPQWFLSNPTFEHYRLVLFQTLMPLGFRNSFIMSIASVILAGGISALAAYGFSRYRFKANKPLMIFLLVTKMLPASVLVVPIYVMMNGFKMLDSFPGMIAIYTAINIPFSIWILRAFYDSLPYELDEAATIDGCNRFSVFWRVLLPLVVPGLISISAITFFSCWNEFILAMTLTSTSQVQPMSIGLYTFMSEQGVKYGPIAAAASLAIIIPATLFTIFQKHFISGMTSGAVKG